MLLVVEKLSPVAMASELEIIDSFPLVNYSGAVNSKNNKYLSMFNERLIRLNEFINTYTLAYQIDRQKKQPISKLQEEFIN